MTCIGQSPRVIFVGDSGVGKTSIITRATNNVFEDSPSATIGANARPLTVMIDKEERRLQLWDTAGQEVYRSIVPLYFKQARCAVVVFAMNERGTYDNIEEWIATLRDHSTGNVPVVVAGNKADMKSLAVSAVEAKTWAESNGYELFFTSAASGQGISDMMERIAALIGPDDRTVQEPTVNKDGERKCC